MTIHTPAGPLRHVVAIQQPVTTTVDGLGATAPTTWTAVYSAVRAEVRPLRGDQYLAGQQLASIVDTKVRIRYHSGILPGYRVVFGSKIFKIVTVINPEYRNIYIDMMCIEIHESAS